MQYLPIVISVVSVIVAVVTLYITNLRHPEIHSYVGPIIRMYYPSDGGFAMYIPITFINAAPRAATVLRAGVLLYPKGSTQEQFFIEWRSFSKLDIQTQNWTYETMCHALFVGGKSSVNKVVWFSWSSSSRPQLVIGPGEYVLTLFYWLDGQRQPKADSYDLHISKEIFELLEGYRTASRGTTVEVLLDERLARNRVMTADEVSKLLKS